MYELKKIKVLQLLYHGLALAEVFNSEQLSNEQRRNLKDAHSILEKVGSPKMEDLSFS